MKIPDMRNYVPSTARVINSMAPTVELGVAYRLGRQVLSDCQAHLRLHYVANYNTAMTDSAQGPTPVQEFLQAEIKNLQPHLRSPQLITLEAVAMAVLACDGTRRLLAGK